jgi:hypothetical protein
MRRLARKQRKTTGTAVSDLVHMHKQQLFFIVWDPFNHTVEYQSFGLMMGTQGMNDGDGNMMIIPWIIKNTIGLAHSQNFTIYLSK